MKTLKQRAFEYASNNDKPSSFFNDLEKSYIAGATEQKNIDIDKISKYLLKNIKTTNTIDINNGIHYFITKDNLNLLIHELREILNKI